MELCKIKDAIKTSMFKKNLNTLSSIQLLDVLSNETILHIYNDIVISQAKRIYIFTDGNCKNNGKKNAIAAYCVYSKDAPVFNTLEQINQDKITNNIAELSGMYSIYSTIYDEYINISEPIEFMICADSEYSIKCVNEWMDKWSKNGWKKTDGKTVLNQDILGKISILKKRIQTNGNIQIKFKHVMSHKVEPVDKNSMEYYYWRGNKLVDDKINKFLVKK